MAFRLINPALHDYQRPWRDYQVDKNLADEWLESLNCLSCFELISVCEGHYQCNDQYPQLILFARRAVFSRLKHLLLDRKPLHSILNSWIGADTNYNLTYTIGISDTPEDTYNYDRIKLSLRRIHPRISEELDAATSAWFEQTIYIVKMIDEFVSNRIRRIPSGAECFGHSRLSRSSGWLSIGIEK